MKLFGSLPLIGRRSLDRFRCRYVYATIAQLLWVSKGLSEPEMVRSRIQLLSKTEIAQYCRQRLPDLVQRGSEWRGPCPMHQGTRDSFAVDPASGAWYCHSHCQEGGNIFQLEMKLTGRDFPEARAEVERIVGRPAVSKPSAIPSKSQIVATYDYRDERGQLLYQQVRYEPKKFRFRRSVGRCGWIWNLDGVQRVLYRLPELLEAEEVFVGEGEKDCDLVVSKNSIDSFRQML